MAAIHPAASCGKKKVHIPAVLSGHNKIDKWAGLFKARTWEEIKMLAKEDAYLESVANTMYSSVTDPAILSLCRMRQGAKGLKDAA
ncbi:MAG: hypothetical protein K6F35_10815 [Lachnospiraceae bacterium]|nr:hypothetical protein [Lachnospiraceae bacterium]